MPTFAPVESALFDTARGGAVDVDGFGEPGVDCLGELEAEPTALGLGGRIFAASAGHAAAMFVGVYVAELMLEGDTLAIRLDTFG